MTIGAKWLLALAPAAATLAAPPAAAITADLAKACRAMAIRAHPTARPGSAKGTGEAQRAYFRECVEKDGKMPDVPGSQAPK